MKSLLLSTALILGALSPAFAVDPSVTVGPTTPFPVQVENGYGPGPAAASTSAPVTPANPPVGAANFATSQVTCGTTATLVLSARTGVSGVGRILAMLTDTSSGAFIYLGSASVTTSTGAALMPRTPTPIDTTAALYCVVPTGTLVLSVAEIY